MITSVVFLVISGYAIYYGNKMLIRNRKMDLSARKTKARINEYKREKNRNGKTLYYPVYKFQNEAGETTFVKSSIGTSWKPKKEYQNIMFRKGSSGYEIVVDTPFYKFTLPKLVMGVGAVIFVIITIVLLNEYTSVFE